jgi:hypothetical protein
MRATLLSQAAGQVPRLCTAYLLIGEKEALRGRRANGTDALSVASLSLLPPSARAGLVSARWDHTLKSRVIGNDHARFGIGGERSDPDADHTKDKREMKDAQHVTMKNGKPAMKGQCAVCGTTMFAIVGAKKG